MFRYTSKKDQKIEAFQVQGSGFLDPTNRWVRLSVLLPWDELAEVYGKTLSNDMGAPSIDARVVIGAVIIKHKLKLDDRGAIELIRENPYMQYFLGLDAFSHKAVFDPSLFVSIRKRLGLPEFDEMTNGLIERVEHIEAERGKKKR
jgi:transposase, IS5 family